MVEQTANMLDLLHVHFYVTGKRKIEDSTWANKKYRGHRVLPESIMAELDDSNIS